MQIRIKDRLILLLAIIAVSTAGATAQSPAAPPRAELALDYTYLRSNAPPGNCGCFNLNGGSATFALLVGHRNFAVVGDFSVAHAGAISNNGYSLTLSTFTAGGTSYMPRLGHSPLRPFGQILAGFAHSSGSLVEGQNGAPSNAGGTFAANVGGGVDFALGRRFSLRLAEADYLVTTFDNGANDHQNNLRLSTGVVVHF